MNFTLTIQGDTPTELLAALQQLGSSQASEKPTAAPTKTASRVKAPPAVPSAPTPQELPAPQTNTEPSPAPEAPSPAHQQALQRIRDLARSLIVAGKSKQTQQILRSTGVRTISDIPPERCAEVWEQLCQLKEAVDAAE